MSTGLIICLNGPSSAGKTSIANALQELFDEPFLHISKDQFVSMLPERYLGVGPQPSKDGFLLIQKHSKLEARNGIYAHRLIFGMSMAIAAMAIAENNVIVDAVLSENLWLKRLVKTLHKYRVFFVGVRCPFEVIQQRELQRGDRLIGIAETHFDTVHRYGIYDIEVDTSLSTADECAQQIKQYILEGNHPHAFNQLLKVFHQEEELPCP